jgi:hypothetical protein
MNLIDEAIIVLWEEGFSVWQIAYQVDVSLDYVHDVLDYYYGW